MVYAAPLTADNDAGWGTIPIYRCTVVNVFMYTYG